MRNFIFSLLISFNFLNSQVQNVTWTVDPNPFNEDQEINLKVSGIDTSKWGVDDIYLWTWYFDSNDVEVNSSINWNGDWSNSNESMKMTKNQDGSFSFKFKPTDLYKDTGIGKIGVLAKAKNGTGDKKTPDHFFKVGKFDLTVNSPEENPYILERNGSFNISVSGDIELNYILKNDKDTVHTVSNNKNFNKQIFGPESNENGFKLTKSSKLELYAIDLNNSSNSRILNFDIIVEPIVKNESPPIELIDGINRLDDNTKVYLQLTAPNKDFVYVIGNFNDYKESDEFLMNKYPDSNTFWIELNELNSKEYYYYQYSLYKIKPLTNSPSNVKVADPYSELVLSPFDDPYVPVSSYENIPDYPNGQEREFTLFKTQKDNYNWKVTEFIKPKKEDLVIYEVLIRDFDKNRNFQDLINRIDYFKNLNINAIELMPIMEFEGNESWGYNPSFHLALDKFYGSPEKFKELVDLFHQNGIAIILDLTMNHSFGRNSLVRMWMDDPDNNGWGGPSSENPYFNTVPKHSYNVGYDFNHQSELTQIYTKRVIKHWIEEYKIDGFRWDLTKGFTQNCSESNYDCTNQYQQDRVDILKMYANYSWLLDDNHYVIFEHLGTDLEEKEWANYRIDEGKGIMIWGKMNSEYNQLTMGYSDNSEISRADHKSRGFDDKRLITYAESHDEERLMFKNLNYGNTSNSEHNVKEIEVSLDRMKSLGASLLLIPGPKMIWHFSEMGMENSIFTCEDGTYGAEDCKLSTKPQPQWKEDWNSLAKRKEIYNYWKKLIELKINEPVFEGQYELGKIDQNNLLPSFKVWNNDLKNDELKYIYVVSNFEVNKRSVVLDLPYKGEWKNLLNDEFIDFSENSTLDILPGTSIVLGNYLYCGSIDTDDDGVGDLCDDDRDGDGILNDNDTCPDSKVGVTVDVTGCELFTLPLDNNKVSVTSSTCIGTNDGSIGLSVEDASYSYSVTVTGKDDPISLGG
ncbi:MAG: thrombospondin type 3 repeat-containing protein, partial [Flavobacteriaceae bacterium]|nr:thrombospondin type 3 repeat-containing protein [Flavobacteriaceae bacterium]